jgi:hypothetical protein
VCRGRFIAPPVQERRLHCPARRGVGGCYIRDRNLEIGTDACTVGSRK